MIAGISLISPPDTLSLSFCTTFRMTNMQLTQRRGATAMDCVLVCHVVLMLLGVAFGAHVPTTLYNQEIPKSGKHEHMWGPVSIRMANPNNGHNQTVDVVATNTTAPVHIDTANGKIHDSLSATALSFNPSANAARVAEHRRRRQETQRVRFSIQWDGFNDGGTGPQARAAIASAARAWEALLPGDTSVSVLVTWVELGPTHLGASSPLL